MIYITQLIFLKPGKEATFHEFEKLAIPLLKDYNGQLIYRIRPPRDAYIHSEGEQPYEVHFISFTSEQDFTDFLNDKTRNDFLHLKEESIQASILIKGQKL